MKLPRWLLICLTSMSVAGILCLFGLWWVKWPEDTARWFLDRLAHGEVAETNAALRCGRWYCFDEGATLLLSIPDEAGSTTQMEFYPLSGVHELHFQLEARNIADLLLGRLRLVLVNQRGEANHWMNGKAVHFVVERGRITYRLIRCPYEICPFE